MPQVRQTHVKQGFRSGVSLALAVTEKAVTVTSLALPLIKEGWIQASLFPPQVVILLALKWQLQMICLINWKIICA